MARAKGNSTLPNRQIDPPPKELLTLKNEPVQSRLKTIIRQLDTGPGVYLMKDRLGTVIYVGKAKNLKKRVSSYFQSSRRTQTAQPKIAAMIPLVFDIETVGVRSETEALLLEGRLIKEYRPRYNTDFTDNKQFLLVRVDTSNELPRFRLVRNRRDDQARYFGPFAHSGLLRRTLAEMRREFGILLSDASPEKTGPDTWRLYNDARAEIYAQTSEVTTADYRQRVEQACVFLEGKSREWLATLKEDMAQAAEARRYERAAQLRDTIQALEATLEPARRFTAALPLPDRAAEASAALEGLAQHLELPSTPAVIECFDISHISGNFVVASMVRFANARPDKPGYRRYRIQSFIGNDDFRAMEEVVGRRYQRLHEEQRPFPNLIVIDGGLGQVRAALKSFLALELPVPPLIGLAKREESIVFADQRPPLLLPKHDPALRLLQRIRDEAHRFANNFSAELRSRKLRESILDDFPGLGPVRRQALLKHFGSLDKLRRASPAAIADVDGIGPARAEALHRFLSNPMALGGKEDETTP